MSKIKEIKESLNNEDIKDCFNQIPQTNPYRRTQSEILNHQNVNQLNGFQSQYPLFPQKKIQTPNIEKLKPLKSKVKKQINQSQSALNLRGGFDPLNHVPPKYDIYGYLRPIEKRRIDMSVLENKDNMKIPWLTKNSNKSGAMTRTELLSLRKKEKLPDISYDLDKDGYVGGRDLVISKMFDVDKDGKLNEKEKAAAYEALANNIEQQYVWNRDKMGVTRPFRFMQKRGQFIEAEDFCPIRETYPVHPLTKVVPHVATFTELKKLRKEENIKEINKKISDYENQYARLMIYDYNDKENNGKKKPSHYSIKQIKEEKTKNDRIKCGLEPEFTEIRDLKKHPGLEYVYDPVFKTKKEIKEAYKKENLEESKKLANTKHQSDIDRLNQREDEIFAKLYSEEDRLTYSKIKEQKRKETNEYNIKKFSNQVLGVHGHEIPKFAESEKNKEFWKLKEGYCENPKFKSQCEYLESIKYYKPPGEDLLLNEHRDEEPNWVDPFKKVHVLDAKCKKQNLITKINNINVFKNFDPNNPKPIDLNYKNIHIYRWTTLVDKFAPNKFKKGRFFDSLPKEGEKTEKNTNIKGFMSDYFKNKDPNNKSDSVKGKENGSNVDTVILGKDCLFQKYSTKEQNKINLPKTSMARTKGF